MNNIEYYFSIGTNTGDRSVNLRQVIDYLKEHMKILSSSSVYKTAPVNMKPGTDYFFNMVVKIESSIDPCKMLALIKNIEKKMGRENKSRNGIYDDRIIDIDILLAGEQILNSEKLTIPHKEMLRRAFVLVPICEVSPDLLHPVNKRSVSSFLDSLKYKNEVIKVDCINC